MPRDRRPVIVLCDLIADLALHIESFPVDATDLKKLAYVELGPGGACNIAIMARRFGLPVACLGEVGEDRFGAAVLHGLVIERVDATGVVVSPDVRTPVAGVLVDARAEPAYLGYPGTLRLSAVPETWLPRLRSARAVFADGWAEHAGVAAIILEAFRVAKDACVPVLFDPGPGNPAVDNGWHRTAAALATVVLANEQEAERLTGRADPVAAAQALLSNGVELAVVKRGAEGCLLATRRETVLDPAYPVSVVDATGAGDSVAGAVIYGWLNGLKLAELGRLANATGAAKVQKRGTGHNVPTCDEVRAVLERFGEDAGMLGSKRATLNQQGAKQATHPHSR
jgi:5-dehydro-2-deoxygluconokinase